LLQNKELRSEIKEFKEKEEIAAEKLQNIEECAEDLQDRIKQANEERGSVELLIKEGKVVRVELQAQVDIERAKVEEAMKLLKGKKINSQQKGWWPPAWF
jgi:hypothetical protein